MAQQIATWKPGPTGGGVQWAPLPPAGYVRLRAARHPELGLVAELTDHVTVVAGGGEHEIVDIPGGEGITSYKGRQPLALRIPLLFDGLPDESKDHEVRVLERMHGIDADLPGPPLLIVEGIGIPHSYSREPKRRYVLDGDPEYGEIRTIGDSGRRGYVEAVVIARSKHSPSSLPDVTPDRDGGQRHTITVPEGDAQRTLRAIAKRHDVQWRKLVRLNPKLPHDPDKWLPPGTKVRVR
jgi:hypothetical protein